MEIEKGITLPKVGDVAVGTVVKVFQTYAIMLFEEGWTGLLHISELSHDLFGQSRCRGRRGTKGSRFVETSFGG